MKFKLPVSLLTVSMALVAHSAFASNYIPCDGCNYAQQSAAALAHGVGRYVVGDVIEKDVNAFRVYSSSHQNSIDGGAASAITQKLYVDDGAITAAETAAFAHLVAFYNIAPVGYQKTYRVQIVDQKSARSATAPVDGNFAAPEAQSQSLVTAPATAMVKYPKPGVNAYTVINGGPTQNQFLTWAGSLPQLSINNAVSNRVKTSALKSLALSSLATNITVHFSDGSHIGVYVDMTQQPATILVNEASAVDSHGNNIPATLASVAGPGKQSYTFGGGGNITDRPNMDTQIGNFGISVPSSSSSGGGYTCVTRSEGNGVVITCKAL